MTVESCLKIRVYTQHWNQLSIVAFSHQKRLTRSRPGTTFLTSVTSRTSAALKKLSTIWSPKSNERRPEIIGFHSREKAEIKMETFSYRKSRIWEMKEDKCTKSLAKNQVCAIFLIWDTWKNVLPKFIKLCMERQHDCVPFRGTNMATRNQQKHLFLSFLLMREFLAWGTYNDWSNIYSETRNV